MNTRLANFSTSKFSKRTLYTSITSFMQPQNSTIMNSKLLNRISRVAFIIALFFLFAGVKSYGQAITQVKYGYLYNWYAAADARGIVNTSISGQEMWKVNGYKAYPWELNGLYGKYTIPPLREIGAEYWVSTIGTNTLNFNMRGGGQRGQYQNEGNGIFDLLKGRSVHMVMNDADAPANDMWVVYTQSGGTSYAHSNYSKKAGVSIRIFRPATSPEQLLVDGTYVAPYIGNDGKVYRTVKIGDQVWLADNLAETKYRNGDIIPFQPQNPTVQGQYTNTEWSALTTGARCAYDNNEGNVLLAPYITLQPLSVEVCEGAGVIFNISVTGATSYMMQTSIDGGVTWSNSSPTEQSLTDPASIGVSMSSSFSSNGFKFRWMFTGYNSSKTISDAAELIVKPLATISSNPLSTSVLEGSTATFTATATNATSYKWEVSTNNGTNWSEISGATGANYTTEATTFGMNNTFYHCIAVSSCGVNSSPSSAAVLTVTPLSSITKIKYGYLYNWYAVSNTNFAPADCHVPSDAEWMILDNYLGAGVSNAGGKLKEVGFAHWLAPNIGATNESGFTALPGGFRAYDGVFSQIRSSGHWWSATEYNTLNVYNRAIGYDTDYLYYNYIIKKAGHSVRLIYTGSSSTVTDYDNNVYDVVTIGTQKWLKQNWACTKLNNGTPIPEVQDAAAWAALSTGARCVYDNNESNVLLTPYITLHPQNTSVVEGLTATFTATATNATSYKWQISTDNGTSWSDIIGATSTSYTNTAPIDGDLYRFVAINSFGASISNVATLTVSSSPSAAYDWLWAKRSLLKDSGFLGAKCKFDNAGNIILADQTTQPIFTIGNTTYTNMGSYDDNYIVKYNAQGDVLWSKSFGSSYFDRITTLSIDNFDNIYVSGDVGAATTIEGTQFGPNESFLLKYNAQGVFQWVKNTGASVSGVAIDPTGDPILFGEFRGSSVVVCGLTINKLAIMTESIYIAKLDANGNGIWGIAGGSPSSDYEDIATSCIKVDGNGNIFCTGGFKGSMSVISLSNGLSNFYGKAGYSNYLLKILPNGSFGWLKKFGTNQTTYVNDDIYPQLTTDLDGNVIIAGSNSYSNVVFDSFILNKNVNDGYVVKYNPNGVVQWAKSSNSRINSLVADNSKNIFLAGGYSNNNSSEYLINPILLKLDLDGNIFDTRLLEGSGTASFITIDINRTTNELIFGGHSYTGNGDSNPLEKSYVKFGNSLILNNYRDFIVKYGIPCTNRSSSILSCIGDCNENTQTLQLDLAGAGPWNIGWAIGDASQTPLTITTSPYTLNTSTRGTYYLTDLKEGNCDGTIQGILNLNKAEISSNAQSFIKSACSGDYLNSPIKISLAYEGDYKSMVWFKDLNANGEYEETDEVIDLQLYDYQTYQMYSPLYRYVKTPGSYYVIITNKFGQKITKSITLDEINETASFTENLICNGDFENIINNGHPETVCEARGGDCNMPIRILPHDFGFEFETDLSYQYGWSEYSGNTFYVGNELTPKSPLTTYPYPFNIGTHKQVMFAFGGYGSAAFAMATAMNGSGLLTLPTPERTGVYDWKQSVTLASNTEYEFSFWTTRIGESYNPANIAVYPSLDFGYIDNNGNFTSFVATGQVKVSLANGTSVTIPATTDGYKLEANLEADGSTQKWYRLTYRFTSGSQTNLTMAITNYIYGDSYNGYALDDISLKEVNSSCEQLEISMVKSIELVRPGLLESMPYESSTLGWKFNKLPELAEGMPAYRVVIQAANESVASDGTLTPQWEGAYTDTIDVVNLTKGVEYNLTLSDLLPGSGNLRNAYWRVGLISLPKDANKVYPIEWSQGVKFSIQPINKVIASGDFLVSQQHTNSINWNYSITYLDNNHISEGISYTDGIGRTRQVQGKNYTHDAILTTETAYSNEGGGSVQTMAAPKGTNQFGYAHRFFDTQRPDGKYVDFSTENFDREIKDLSTGRFNLITPSPVASNPGSVGWYYSNQNNLEPYTDNAGGYPYIFNVAYASPLGRPWKSANGAGEVFKITGGKEKEYFYGQPTAAELERIYGKGYVRDSLDVTKISRETVYDADGVGYITYKDNEGKVLATALTDKNPLALLPLNEPGTGTFNILVNPIQGNELNEERLEMNASGRFDIPYGEVPVTLKYKLNLSSFTVSDMACAECKYRVWMKIVNSATGEVVKEMNKDIVPSQNICTGSDEQVSILDTVMNLQGPAGFVITRRIEPMTNKETGERIVEEAATLYDRKVHDEISTYRYEFEKKYNKFESFYVLRKTFTHSDDPIKIFDKNCSEIITISGNSAGNGCAVSGALNSVYYNDPKGIAVDDQGNWYVSDATNQFIQKIESFESVSVLAGSIGTSGSTDGMGTLAKFNEPYDIVWNNKNIYVADRLNNAVRRINQKGTVKTIATASDGLLAPEGICVDRKGNIYVASTGNGKIIKISNRGVVTRYVDGGLPVGISDVVADRSGNLYITDRVNNKLLYYNLASNAVVDKQVSGLNRPVSVGLDNFGFVYISNQLQHNIIKYNTATLQSTVVAGSGVPGYLDGESVVSQINTPTGIYVTDGGEVCFSDSYNHCLRKAFTKVCPNDVDPCATGNCGSYRSYADEVSIRKSLGQKMISDLDGQVKIGLINKREQYLISDTLRVGELTSGAILDSFKVAYQRANWVNLNNNSLKVYLYSLTVPSGSSISGGSMPVLLDDRSIDINHREEFFLLKAIIQSDCNTSCTWHEFNGTCDSKCNERREAYKLDMNLMYDSIAKSPCVYKWLIFNNITLKRLVNYMYPLPSFWVDKLTESDEQLYDQYDVARTAYEKFDTEECLRECNNQPPPPCEYCQADYMSCVFEKADQLMTGVENLMGKWEDPNDPENENPKFPYVAESFYKDNAINLNLKDSLGTALFNYLYANINNTYVTTQSNWSPMGGPCKSCIAPVGDGCDSVPGMDVSKLPSIVIPLLETESNQCYDQYNGCVQYAANDLSLNYLCNQGIQDCLNSLPPETSNYYTDPNSEGFGRYSADLLACNSLCTQNRLNLNLPDFVQREAMVRETLLNIYPSIDDAATVDRLTDEIIIHSFNENMNLAILQDYLMQYEALEMCRKNCKANFEWSFMQTITELIAKKKDEIRENYVRDCYGHLNESMEVTYPFNMYHYMLYRYDYAGKLKGTTPPEGVDIIDIYNADPAVANRVPQHMMTTKYEVNSLYTTAQASPDEGRTEFLYDKAGRVRFSQDAEQRKKLAQGQLCFSYTKYDPETKNIIETGEYRAAVDAVVGGFKTPEAGQVTSALGMVENPVWPTDATRTYEVTTNTYDIPTLNLAGYTQRNLAGRISMSRNENGAMYYSYDHKGRVELLVNEVTALGSDRFKTINYYYTPLTARVDSVVYQKDSKLESFRHKYLYDMDDKLAEVYVSRNGKDWLDAATYNYYTNGKLQTAVLGDKVQKVDYVYTINSWVKSINALIGGSGPADGAEYGKDAFAEVLSFFPGDYQRLGTGLESNSLVTPQVGTPLGDQSKGLYSGNISSITTYTAFDLTASSSTPNLMGQSYRYDRLNRLVDTYTATANRTGFAGFTDDVNSYFMHQDFDANGNIMAMIRRYQGRYLNMDDMQYRYSLTPDGRKINNLLNHVNDNGIVFAGLSDIKDQGVYSAADPNTWNYRYNSVGQLIQNGQDGIASIEWTIADKIKRVVPTVTTKPTLEYGYDALNNRQGKKSVNADGSYTQTLYVNDATGKAMAIYTKEHTAVGVDTYTLKEQNIFGSSRLGSFAAAQDLSSATTVEFAKNRFRFELTDHLGNVRAVVSGAKTLEGNPIVLNLTDYYPYGMDMPSRTFVNETYRYGFNGKERDNLNGSSAVYDYGFRIYESRIGRFLSVDPLTKKFPWYTPYQFAGNKPIWAIDLDGLEEEYYDDNFKSKEGQVVLQIALSTTLGKEYYGKLKSQTEYDVYYVDMMGSFDRITTSILTSEMDIAEYPTLNYFDKLKPLNRDLLKKSFSQGKKVIAVGMSSRAGTYNSYLKDKKMKIENYKNDILEPVMRAAYDAQDELMHALNDMKFKRTKMNDETAKKTIKFDHDKFYGKGRESIPFEEAQKKEYENTRMNSSATEINNEEKFIQRKLPK